jgi:hypothetical protein
LLGLSKPELEAILKE